MMSFQTISPNSAKRGVIALCATSFGFFLSFFFITQHVIAQTDWVFNDSVVIDYQKIDVTIKDQIATTHLDMQFSNTSSWMVEGTYQFPIPPHATIVELILYIDDEPVVGEVLDAGDAQQIYQDYVDNLIDPALLFYVDEGLVQVNVFPIEAGDSRRIEITYQEVLAMDENVVAYRFMQNMAYSAKPIALQTIKLDVESNEEMVSTYSDSHPVSIMNSSSFSATAAYEAADIIPDSNFEFDYTVSPDTLGFNLLSHNPADEDGYFLLQVAPSLATTDTITDVVIAKDVLFVVDTSGSMGGEAIEQAKSAILDVVSRLNPEDRFNIVAFDTFTDVYADSLVTVDDAGDYAAYVNGLDASGSTNISDALLDAFTQIDSGRLTNILFLTDGRATDGETSTSGILSVIAPYANSNIRLFSFGLGGADLQLIESLTDAHQGDTTFIDSSSQLEQAVTDFYNTISRPVLTNITIDFGDAPVEKIFPQAPYDLFLGAQLIIAGRYDDTSSISTTSTTSTTSATTSFPITLTGDFEGEQQTFVFDSATLLAEGGSEVIAIEWAKRYVDYLLSQIAIQGEVSELVDLVRDLGIQYQIVTPYTSYLVEEPLPGSDGGGLENNSAGNSSGASQPPPSAPPPSGTNLSAGGSPPPPGSGASTGHAAPPPTTSVPLAVSLQSVQSAQPAESIAAPLLLILALPLLFMTFSLAHE